MSIYVKSVLITAGLILVPIFIVSLAFIYPIVALFILGLILTIVLYSIVLTVLEHQ